MEIKKIKKLAKSDIREDDRVESSEYISSPRQ